MLFVFLAVSVSGYTTFNFTNIPSTNSPPSKRYSHTMNYAPSYNFLVTFGGQIDFKTFYDDTWTFSLDSMTWNQITPISSNNPGKN
jgi:Galactose oxidase, central domain